METTFISKEELDNYNKELDEAIAKSIITANVSKSLDYTEGKSD